MSARHPMQSTLDAAHEAAQAARFDDAPPAGRWPIATAHLQRGVPGLRYPRTMHGTDAAFPDSPEYACAIQRYDVSPRLDWRWSDGLSVTVFVGVVAALAVGLI